MTDEPTGAIEEIQSALEMPEQADLAPVYAEFGAAIHDTQVLEFGLVLLMALATRYDDAKFDSDAVSNLSSAQAGQTIGELFRAVRKKEHFTSPERKAIHKAIRLRNDLVHRFMIDKVERLLSAEGRQDLMEELHAIRRAVQYADQIIASLMNHYLDEYGATLEELQDYASSLFEQPAEKADEN
jgi:uncharacterized protein YutE (UPF0331/DUF86 family)